MLDKNNCGTLCVMMELNGYYTNKKYDGYKKKFH